MLGVQEREEQHDRNGLRALLLEALHGFPCLLHVKWLLHVALVVDALHDLLAQPWLHGRVLLHVDVGQVAAEPRDVPDVVHAAEAVGDKQPHARALVLHEDVRADRRAVGERCNLSCLEVGVEQLAQAVDDRASGFLGRGRDLQHVDLAGLVLEHDHVGERSARVNCNRLHREPAFLAWDRTRTIGVRRRSRKAPRGFDSPSRRA